MMSSREEIAAAARFANESPAKPLRFSVIVAILLLLVAHASFSFFALRLAPWLFDAPKR